MQAVTGIIKEISRADAKLRVRFHLWKAAAQKHVNKLGIVGCDDIWDETDSYDLRGEADVAFGRGESPAAFIERVFQEDISSQAYDEELERESLEWNQLEGGEEE